MEVNKRYDTTKCVVRNAKYGSHNRYLLMLSLAILQNLIHQCVEWISPAHEAEIILSKDKTSWFNVWSKFIL